MNIETVLQQLSEANEQDYWLALLIAKVILLQAMIQIKDEHRNKS